MLVASLTGVATAQAQSGSSARELMPASGDRSAAELVSIAPDWQITLQQAGKERTVAAADIAWWGAPVEPSSRRGVRPADRAWVLLTGGGLLVADVLGVKDSRLELGSLALGEFALSLDRVQGILFRPPSDAARRDGWLAQLQADAPNADRLLLANGDVLSGNLAGLNAEGVTFQTGGIDLPAIPLDRVAAIGLRSPPTNTPTKKPGEATKLTAWIGFTDGSRLLATRLQLEAGRVEAAAAGHSFSARAARLCWIQPLGGRVTYLSDLTPAGYKHVPFLTLPWPYHADANVLGRPLRVREQWYAKGLGMHSRSRLTYALGQGYSEFAAEVALDAAAGSQGSAVCLVFEGRELKYRSPLLRAGDPPQAVRVPLAGGESLTLVVDFGERGDVQDHVNWLNARLIASP